MLREGPTTNGMTKHEAKRLACILAYWLAATHSAGSMPDGTGSDYDEQEQIDAWVLEITARKQAFMELGKQFLRDHPDFGAGEDRTLVVEIVIGGLEDPL